MPEKIRVLHVLHAFSTGGLENGIVNIINRSPEHLEHELCFMSKGGDFLKRLSRPVVFHELHKTGGNDVRLILKLREIFKRSKINVIHTRNWAAFDAVIAACVTPGATLIHGEHGRDIADPQGLILRRNLARRLLSFRAKKYIAVSRDLYGWLRETVRIPERKLAYIPNGVDVQRFHPGKDADLRTELGIGPNEFVIGAIGRLDPIKNHEGLLRAVQSVQSRHAGVRLVVVGDGPCRESIESTLRDLQLSPASILLGARSDVNQLYRAFDLFALNSFGEGMSNTLLEAMASGLPIVCTAVGGNSELVADKERGLLIPPGNDERLAEAICAFIESAELRDQCGRNARRFVDEHYSLRRMIDKYVALYESVA